MQIAKDPIFRLYRQNNILTSYRVLHSNWQQQAELYSSITQKISTQESVYAPQTRASSKSIDRLELFHVVKAGSRRRTPENGSLNGTLQTTKPVIYTNLQNKYSASKLRSVSSEASQTLARTILKESESQLP